MVAALLICVLYGFLLWLAFFKFRWLKFSIVWGVVSAWVGLHLVLVFIIGLRFVTPYSTDARIIQHTIQLVPRLSEPTLVTAVLVKPDVPVRKGQTLFQFDRRPYESKVTLLKAELAAARQNVRILKANLDAAIQSVKEAESKRDFAREQAQRYTRLAKTGSGSERSVQQWASQLRIDEATILKLQAEQQKALLAYESQIDGVNTTVAQKQAELDLALFYLDNTTLVAPEDGRIVNLQVRPGMVAGE